MSIKALTCIHETQKHFAAAALVQLIRSRELMVLGQHSPLAPDNTFLLLHNFKCDPIQPPAFFLKFYCVFVVMVRTQPM